jgi:hypothetical protein
MPYAIIKNGKKWSVINRVSGHNFSPNGITKKMAQRQMRALYANTKKLEGGKATTSESADADKIYESMSDKDLHEYFPHAKVIKYSELPQGVGAEYFMPKNNSVTFILYEQDENEGHWVALVRGKDKFYYFDSYGNRPDVPLSWNTAEKNEELQQSPVLTKMLQMTRQPVYYNDYQYQSNSDGISTCGRWGTAFATHVIKYHGDLKSFKKETLGRAKKVGKGLDHFIAHIYDE